RIATPAAAALTWQWIATRDLHHAPRDLARFSAVWLVPASPYQNMAGALAAVRFARETKRPFLGTCGGFQHALIEFARNVAGLAEADHAESNPNSSLLLVSPLSCPLDAPAPLHFSPGSLVHRAYNRTSASEAYRCSFGLNPAHRDTLERAGLSFTAFDDDGSVRAVELPEHKHPFFVGTLFQPERTALRNETPPLVTAFVEAVANSEKTCHR
ncbi:MAG: hypothetical protein ABIR80_12525, partial [Opitutaceae bacterium]